MSNKSIATRKPVHPLRLQQERPNHHGSGRGHLPGGNRNGFLCVHGRALVACFDVGHATVGLCSETHRESRLSQTGSLIREDAGHQRWCMAGTAWPGKYRLAITPPWPRTHPGAISHAGRAGSAGPLGFIWATGGVYAIPPPSRSRP